MKKSALYQLFTGAAIGNLLMTLAGLFSNNYEMVANTLVNALVITVLLQIGAVVDARQTEVTK